MSLARAGAFALALFLGGCGYTYHFVDGSTLRGEEHNEWASYFLFGIVGDHEIDVREFCPEGVHEITTGNNFLTWLLGAITIGIYTPRKVNIWCAGRKSAFAIDVGDDGRPSRVTRSDGATGVPRAVAPGRYAVALRTGGAR